MKKIVIGITDCGSFSNYEKWILLTPDIEVVRLSYKENNIHDTDRCHGIILSGGEDIHPRYYNKSEYLEFCNEIDEKRDDFEWKVLERMEAGQQPLLGICRGLQVANVFYGGSLIPDIPSFGKFNHSKFPDRDRYHDVLVDSDSLLAGIATTLNGKVNSAHHQSADRVGKDLVANCFSPDGVVEGIERKSVGGKPFLMLAQWHPERMTDLTSPFSNNIRESFLVAAAERN